jgi:hypothetical protein
MGLGPGTVGVAPGEVEGDGGSIGGVEGGTVGSGCCRQIGMFGLGVGVGFGVGLGFGGGARVGSGCGGTRGSGKRGSLAAESACERFQSGPYGCAEAFGEALTEIGPTDCNVCSVA